MQKSAALGCACNGAAATSASQHSLLKVFIVERPCRAVSCQWVQQLFPIPRPHPYRVGEGLVQRRIATVHPQRAAFERADANRDGQLSAQEARQLPAISQRFEEIDSDRNGQLSRAEFDKGAQQY